MPSKVIDPKVRDHVAQDHVAQDHVAQDHVAQDHVVQDHAVQDHGVLDHAVVNQSVTEHVAVEHVVVDRSVIGHNVLEPSTPRHKVTALKPFGVLVEPFGGKVKVQDLNIDKLRELFTEHQLVVLRGFDTFENAEDFSGYCEHFGEVSLWPFGKILELIEEENPEDHIFDNSYMPLHWDGMYRPQVPEYQIFHCVKAPLSGQGGATTFSNTILALKNAAPAEKEIWSKVSGRYQRKMEFYDSKTQSPVITKHPHKDLSVIRYSEPHCKSKGHFVNPAASEFSGIAEQYLESFHKSIEKALYSPANFYAHEWQSGDIVIADNFSLLHGREKFVSKSPRHIQRVHVLSNPPFENPGLESFYQ